MSLKHTGEKATAPPVQPVNPSIYELECHSSEEAQKLAELFGERDSHHRVEATGTRLIRVVYLREEWLWRVAGHARYRALISSRTYQLLVDELLW